jgi:hypothetical protein
MSPRAGQRPAFHWPATVSLPLPHQAREASTTVAVALLLRVQPVRQREILSRRERVKRETLAQRKRENLRRAA